MSDSTQRFSSRVENYVRYRPGYPPELLDWLRSACRLDATSVIADVGSGTGILSELFLKNGNAVLGVEPNREMRVAGERLLASYPRFTSVEGTAEATTLSAASVDFVVAGQAFHWFDPAAARTEFQRILKPQGWCVLVWNERLDDASPFLCEYERLLQTFSGDYTRVDHRRIDSAALREFFGGAPLEHALPSRQLFDYAGLEGRLLSSSYAPEAGHPNHAPMLAELRRIFDQHQANGTVSFEYAVKVYAGRLGG